MSNDPLRVPLVHALGDALLVQTRGAYSASGSSPGLARLCLPIVFAISCQMPAAVPRATPAVESHNVTIVAVNSSLERREIATDIYVDDRLVFSGLLMNPKEKSQVSIRPSTRIPMTLSRGQHEVRVSVPDQGAEFQGELLVGNEPIWIWLGYEDWDQNGDKVGINEFAFWHQLEPILFE